MRNGGTWRTIAPSAKPAAPISWPSTPAIITHMRAGAVPGVEFGSEFLAGVDLWPTYDAIHCPTLVLRGAESTLLLKKTAEEMKRRGPKAETIEFAVWATRRGSWRRIR